jgi:Serine carboxypeptidase S28
MKQQLVLLLATLLLVQCCNALSIGDLHLLRHREPPPPPPVGNFSARDVYEEYITQRLDHFNYEDFRTFQMRYYANDAYYQPGGPIFIYVGGEWSVSEGWVTGGHMVDMARDLNGFIFYTEHRFYGLSRPTL